MTRTMSFLVAPHAALVSYLGVGQTSTSSQIWLPIVKAPYLDEW